MDEILKERKTNKTLNELKKEAESNLLNDNYKRQVVESIMKKRADMRKTFLSLLLVYPERIGKIMEKTYFVKRTLYNHLYNLISLGLVKKISILDIIKKNNQKATEEENICLEKFNKWTSTMSEGQKQLFTAKTNYWTLTDFGKDVNLVDWIITCDKRMKSGDESEGSEEDE